LPATLAFSAIRESRTGDIILKIVNGGSAAHSLRFRLSGLDAAMLNASQTVLTDEDPSAFNSFENPHRIAPQTSSLNLQPEFEYTTTPFSLTILRIQNPR
jgi:alpha-L-arabinofuranosidase